MAHSPRPWSVKMTSADWCSILSTGQKVATVLDENIDNARLIVRAVNNHDDLLAVAKKYHSVIDILMARLIQFDTTFMPTKSEFWPDLERGFAAIKKAEEA